jgi:hypothetical protein
MPTYTIYADENDAYLESIDANFANARAGTGSFLLVRPSTSAAVRAGQQWVTTSGGQYRLTQGFFNFDTSAIGGSETVISTLLSLQIFADGSATDFDAEVYEKAFGASVDAGDWTAFDDVGALTEVASRSTSGLGAGYNDWTSEVAFLTAVNKGGDTQIMVCSGRSRAGSVPTGDEYLDLTAADASGTSQDPKLVITTTAPTRTAEGALEADTGALSGAAEVEHAATASLAGAGAAVSGAAEVIHAAAAALTGTGAETAATVSMARDASGTLTGTGAATMGSASRAGTRTSSGALVGAGASMVATTAITRFAAGTLAGADATVSATPAVVRMATGALAGAGAALSATAEVVHPAAGALTGAGAAADGAAAVEHTASASLIGAGASADGEGEIVRTAIAALIASAPVITSAVTMGRNASGVLAGTGADIAAATTLARIASGTLSGVGAMAAGAALQHRLAPAFRRATPQADGRRITAPAHERRLTVRGS